MKKQDEKIVKQALIFATIYLILSTVIVIAARISGKRQIEQLRKTDGQRRSSAGSRNHRTLHSGDRGEILEWLE